MTLRVTLVVTKTCNNQALKPLLTSDRHPGSQSTSYLPTLTSSPQKNKNKKTAEAHTWSHMFSLFLRQCPIFHFHHKQNKRSCTVEVQLLPWESEARRLCFFMSEFNDLCARCNVIGYGQNVSCRKKKKKNKKKKQIKKQMLPISCQQIIFNRCNLIIHISNCLFFIYFGRRCREARLRFLRRAKKPRQEEKCRPNLQLAIFPSIFTSKPNFACRAAESSCAHSPPRLRHVKAPSAPPVSAAPDLMCRA